MTAVAVILNADAGSALGRGHLDSELQELFRAAGCAAEIIMLGAGQKPAAAGRDARTRASTVVAGGGDGTVSSVAARSWRLSSDSI